MLRLTTGQAWSSGDKTSRMTTVVGFESHPSDTKSCQKQNLEKSTEYTVLNTHRCMGKNRNNDVGRGV